MEKGKGISTDGKFVGVTIGRVDSNHKLEVNEDGSIPVCGESEVKTIFDTLIDKIERDIKFNELTLCKDNIEIYNKFIGNPKWWDWKSKRSDHGNRFIKIVNELTGSKVIELIELGYSRHVLKIDEIVESLNNLITILLYTAMKYNDLSTYDVISRLNTDGTNLELRQYSWNIVNSPLRTSFRVDSNVIDDFKSILNNKIFLNLTDTGEKYRCIGKTSLLAELCNKKNATLIVSSHYIKKALDIHLSKLGYHIQIKYLGKDVNLEGTNFSYYVDEGIPKEQLEKLINQNSNCLGGFVNHESFK